MQHCRVNDAADILDRHIVEHFDVAGDRVDRHMGRMGAIAIGAMGARIGAVGYDAVLGDLGQWHQCVS